MSEQRHRYDLERQIRELEAKVAERDKLLDDLIEHPTADDNVDLRPLINRAAALRGKV